MYIIMLVALACGLLMHITARVMAEKLESQKAEFLEKAVAQKAKSLETRATNSSKFVEPVSFHTQFLLIKTKFFCGDVFICLGIGLLVFWMYLGGRHRIWIPLLFLLFDIPFWLF